MVDIPLNYIGFLQPTFCNGVKIGYVYVGARGIASACQKVEVSVSRERVARVTQFTIEMATAGTGGGMRSPVLHFII
jgi:hypothetical protein